MLSKVTCVVWSAAYVVDGGVKGHCRDGEHRAKAARLFGRLATKWRSGCRLDCLQLSDNLGQQFVQQQGCQLLTDPC